MNHKEKKEYKVRFCPLQVGCNEERAKGEGVTDAGDNEETFPQTSAGPESHTGPETGPGDKQEGNTLCFDNIRL